MPEHPRITPRGPFSLKAAAEFGFGPTAAGLPPFDGAMRLAFAVDGGTGHAGALLRQDEPDGPVEVELSTIGEVDREAVLRQVARVVSLDHDGEEFMEVGARDAVLGALQRKHRGQRPVLFHSPYEAAAWAIISARRPARQAAVVRAQLGGRLGATFELGGRTLPAFPTPERLLAGLDEDTPGLTVEKVERLRGVAEAALRGELDVERLKRLGPERAYTDVQRLRGLGPFYAGLVVIRATGFADAPLLVAEPRVLAHAGRLYGGEMTLERFAALAEQWRPFRTWATVLIRLAGDRTARGGAARGGQPGCPTARRRGGPGALVVSSARVVRSQRALRRRRPLGGRSQPGAGGDGNPARTTETVPARRKTARGHRTSPYEPVMPLRLALNEQRVRRRTGGV